MPYLLLVICSGIVKIKKDPKSSYSYEDKAAFEKQWSVLHDDGSSEFTLRKRLFLRFSSYHSYYGLGRHDTRMVVPSHGICILNLYHYHHVHCWNRKIWVRRKGTVDAFVNGASSLVGVSLIIGLARGINLVLNKGMISDTILHFSSSIVQHMSGPLFIIVLLFIFFCLGFIVPSSSGLAVLSMPIFAPLADTVGIPRFVIVTTYQFGQYAMLFLAPTGLVMATLQMLNMRYSHWLRFVWPVVAFVLIFGGGLLITQVLIYS